MNHLESIYILYSWNVCFFSLLDFADRKSKYADENRRADITDECHSFGWNSCSGTHWTSAGAS